MTNKVITHTSVVYIVYKKPSDWLERIGNWSILSENPKVAVTIALRQRFCKFSGLVFNISASEVSYIYTYSLPSHGT